MSKRVISILSIATLISLLFPTVLALENAGVEDSVTHGVNSNALRVESMEIDQARAEFQYELETQAQGTLKLR